MHKSSNAIKNNKGFSLLELMVAIGIVAVLTAITAPSFFSWKLNRVIESQASTVLSALKYSRSRAVKVKASVVVEFDVGNNSYRIFIDNGNGGGTANDTILNGGEEVLKTVTLSVDMTSANFVDVAGGKKAVFDMRGFSNSGTVTLTDNDKEKTISLIGSGSSQIL